jgi:rubrerythrin
MMKNARLDAILAEAIGQELEANRFYKEAAALVKNSSVKETFLQLAKDELDHKGLLERFRDDPSLESKIGPPVNDYKIAESEPLPQLTVEMALKDAIALAMKKEQLAAELYGSLRASASAPEVKTMFENLRFMELGHKARLENIFVDIGYPEVF